MKNTLKSPKQVFYDKDNKGKMCYFKRTDVLKGKSYTKVVVDCRDSRHKKVITAYCVEEINGQGAEKIVIEKKGEKL